jgi:hypothetical protein
MYLKLLATYEKDGVTKKVNTHSVNYDDIEGMIFNEIIDTEIGRSMWIEKVNNNGWNLKTSTVEDIQVIDKKMTVYTRNTIYSFEIIKTYEG